MDSKVRRQSDIARDDEEKARIQGMSLKEWHLWKRGGNTQLAGKELIKSTYVLEEEISRWGHGCLYEKLQTDQTRKGMRSKKWIQLLKVTSDLGRAMGIKVGGKKRNFPIYLYCMRPMSCSVKYKLTDVADWFVSGCQFTGKSLRSLNRISSFWWNCWSSLWVHSLADCFHWMDACGTLSAVYLAMF